MLVTRWQAPVLPSKDQLKLIYNLEGLNAEEETIPGNSKVAEHRHPFDEIRTVISGEMMVDISGNKILLRGGDRVLIPANTRHSYAVENDGDCVSFCAKRIY